MSWRMHSQITDPLCSDLWKPYLDSKFVRTFWWNSSWVRLRKPSVSSICDSKRWIKFRVQRTLMRPWALPGLQLFAWKRLKGLKGVSFEASCILSKPLRSQASTTISTIWNNSEISSKLWQAQDWRKAYPNNRHLRSRHFAIPKLLGGWSLEGYVTHCRLDFHDRCQYRLLLELRQNWTPTWYQQADQRC